MFAASGKCPAHQPILKTKLSDRRVLEAHRDRGRFTVVYRKIEASVLGRKERLSPTSECHLLQKLRHRTLRKTSGQKEKQGMAKGNRVGK